MIKGIDIVPIKDACRLWNKDRKTLKRWAMQGKVLYDIIGDKESKYGIWYIETPTGRHNRLFTNN